MMKKTFLSELTRLDAVQGKSEERNKPYCNHTAMSTATFDEVMRQTRKFCLLLIRVYQKTLSPDHGLLRPFFSPGVCIYRPTCSEYTYQAIAKFGSARGIILGAKRLIRCHPWHEGGHDPIKISRF